MALDPVTLQVMVGGLRAACDEMGALLIQAAHSANIKERHDCSTALFDAGGERGMQAEHIPGDPGSVPEADAPRLRAQALPLPTLVLSRPLPDAAHPPLTHPIPPSFT